MSFQRTSRKVKIHQSHFSKGKNEKGQAGLKTMKTNKKIRKTNGQTISRRPNIPKPNANEKLDQKMPTSDELFWKKVNSCKSFDEFWNETVKVNFEDLSKENRELLDRIQANNISDDSEESDNSS